MRFLPDVRCGGVEGGVSGQWPAGLAPSGVGPTLLQHRAAGSHWPNSHCRDCCLLRREGRVGKQTRMVEIRHSFTSISSFLSPELLSVVEKSDNELNQKIQEESCPELCPPAPGAPRQGLMPQLISTQMCVRHLQTPGYATWVCDAVICLSRLKIYATSHAVFFEFKRTF